MPNLSLHTQKYIDRIRSFSEYKPKEGASTIHADEISMRLASFFEKIRNVVDYRAEHLLRRSAIERILRVKLIFSLRKDGESIAESLIVELIRTGHIPNDSIEETKIFEVGATINKYIYVLNNIERMTEQKELEDWIYGLAACEIEERLSKSWQEKILLEYMYEIMKERITLSGRLMVFEEEKDLYIHIACQKSLLKLDDTSVSYRILKIKYPNWLDLDFDAQELARIAPQVFLIKHGLEKIYNDKLFWQILRICKKHTPPFLIICDLAKEESLNLRDILNDPAALENKIKEYYEKRYRRSKSKVRRIGTRMVTSILLSKMFVAFLLEIPYDIYITQKFTLLNLGISVLAPPFLMFLIASSIRPPARENADEIAMETISIVYHHKENHEIKTERKRGFIMEIILRLLYLLVFIISFGVIVSLLLRLNFSLVSIAIFLVFLCLIGFSGMKTREAAQELETGKERENIVTFLLDTFSMPIVKAGRWLAKEFSKVNFLAFLFNFVLEAPLQVLISFIEDWRYFIKEKKDEIH